MSIELTSLHNFQDQVRFFEPYDDWGHIAAPVNRRTKYGRIVGIRFTEPKVWYDILDVHDLNIYRNVVSDDVFVAPTFGEVNG